MMFLKKYIQENANYTYTPKYKNENMNLTLFEKLEQNLETIKPLIQQGADVNVIEEGITKVNNRRYSIFS